MINTRKSKPPLDRGLAPNKKGGPVASYHRPPGICSKAKRWGGPPSTRRRTPPTCRSRQSSPPKIKLASFARDGRTRRDHRLHMKRSKRSKLPEPRVASLRLAACPSPCATTQRRLRNPTSRASPRHHAEISAIKTQRQRLPVNGARCSARAGKRVVRINFLSEP